MLRDSMYGMGKPVPAIYKAAQAMKTGVAVVVNETDGTFDYPSATTGVNVYFVDKERIATGYKAGIDNLSDYDEVFVNVAKGEFAKLKNFVYGDIFLTDAEGTPTAGKVVAFTSTGTIVDATTASVYEYVKEYNDNGHKLKMIKVLQVPKSNS